MNRWKQTRRKPRREKGNAKISWVTVMLRILQIVTQMKKLKAT